ncbi:LysM peptidoglycan-binding domain-containing protein [Bacillus sp. FJAT-22090]|uniref:LysM peptidoglycan-binding domain-containing protein n=1 Tax=Bacillus sp. FJAT-22090 TaxID=1581038 RepID=UPI00119E5713|nr:LysM peptidoglycan-binding domain-containing protein [Bacillus sp. FJAT-22090]
MNQDDYQKKIDEHRQSIGVEDEKVELSRSRRKNTGKKAKKKSRNILIPTLFCVFILIPVCIFIYVQFFYTPKEVEEVQDAGIIQVETKIITNSTNEKEEETTPEEDQSVAEEQAAAGKTPEKEEPKIEEPKVEEQPKIEQPKKPVVKEEPKQNTPSKTHIVKSNETLYRIAINYYNDPTAVEKIKAANGLSSNEISVGQKLILP